jgi:hypothetical protein
VLHVAPQFVSYKDPHYKMSLRAQRVFVWASTEQNIGTVVSKHARLAVAAVSTQWTLAALTVAQIHMCDSARGSRDGGGAGMSVRMASVCRLRL